MRRQKSLDTAMEISLRRKLFSRGLRYRIHRQLVSGTRRQVDLAFMRARVAVFLDGCFWHGCPQHGTIPRANREWWERKLRSNIERDKDTDRRLAQAGWLVVRVWEHEDLEDAAIRVEKAVRERARRTSRRGRRG